MNKKGSAAVIVILCLIILAGVLVFLDLRECTKNSDCSDNAYCGSDYECHSYPEQVVMKQNSYFSAALVLGISLIVAAYIFKRREKGKGEEEEKENKKKISKR